MTTLVAPQRSPGVAVPRRPLPARLAWLGIAVVALVLVATASVAFGSRVVSLHEIVSAFTGAEDGIAQAAVRGRLPRTILAVVVGATLGLVGTVLQAVTRNPLADPQVLGITSGASLFVVTGIAFVGLASPMAYIWVAIAGSALAATFVYAIGSLGRGGPTPLKLALAGAATSAAFNALISAILLPRIEVMDEFRFWEIGGVGGATYDKLALVAPFLVTGALICFLSARGLNALALGDDVAAGLGERVARTRLLAATGAFILCGAATAVAGPIGFVGLMVPHACRLLVGVDHRWLLPCSALAGATLLTAADVVGRLVARPSEVDVGIVTALIGAPFFIVMVRRLRMRSL